MKKRNCFILICTILLTVLSGCSDKEQQRMEADKDINMIVASDLHYLTESLTDHGPAYQKYSANGDGRLMDYIEPLIDAFCYDVSKQEPDILILSGDLTNNGEKESHLAFAEKLKALEDTAGTKVYVIPGNHDILNPWARGFSGDKQYVTDSVDAKEFKTIYEEFGYEEAISRDRESLSYLASPSEKVWLLMLDTNEYRLNEELGIPTTNGELREGTLEWIKKCSKLAKEKGAKIITVMHHNLLKHSGRIYYGYTLDNSQEVIKQLQECGIHLVLSGHLHIQDIRSEGENEDTIYDIATGALIIYPQHYAKLTYQAADQGLDYSTASVDVDRWAKDKGIKDENLTDYSEYSRKNFYDRAYQRAYQGLTELGTYSEEDCKAMAETMALLNINYFGGTAVSVKEEVMNSKGYKLWSLTEEPEFMKSYILSMIPRKDTDHNRLHITLK